MTNATNPIDLQDLAEEISRLADKFHEGWHEGIRIDATDIMNLNKAAEALSEQAPKQPEAAALGHTVTVKAMSESALQDMMAEHFGSCEITDSEAQSAAQLMRAVERRTAECLGFQIAAPAPEAAADQVPDAGKMTEAAADAPCKPLSSKPHDAGSHNQKMTPALQRVIDAADKRARDKAAMPADCKTPSGCRENGCHGECLPGEAAADAQPQPARVAPHLSVMARAVLLQLEAVHPREDLDLDAVRALCNAAIQPAQPEAAAEPQGPRYCYSLDEEGFTGNFATIEEARGAALDAIDSGEGDPPAPGSPYWIAEIEHGEEILRRAAWEQSFGEFIFERADEWLSDEIHSDDRILEWTPELERELGAIALDFVRRRASFSVYGVKNPIRFEVEADSATPGDVVRTAEIGSESASPLAPAAGGATNSDGGRS